MTAPLVPADIVIPRLPWVPVYADRLWESDFWGVATDAEFRAAFCLWTKSWNQKPPGSLPNDDRMLCRLAELSGNLAKWKKVKGVALRHWIECEDGRLYHPVVAELVIDAANKLIAKQARMANARAARRVNNKPNDKGNNQALPRKNGTTEERTPYSKADPLPPTPLPNGKGEALPASSSLDERGGIAPSEERELYAAINEMRYGRADAYRAGKLAAWDTQNGAKLQHACERLGELQTQKHEQPEPEFRSLATVVETVMKQRSA